jgi:hypothetical protein
LDYDAAVSGGIRLMSVGSRLRSAVRWVATSVGVAAGAYATYAAVAWYRYGDAPAAEPDEADALLDRFMPRYDVVERHHIRVAAPAQVTLGAASDQDLLESPAVRAVFRAREVVLGAAHGRRAGPRGLLAQVQALGWGVLAETPGREVVVGAVTRPWEPDVTFRALAPEEFAAFEDPGYVKIAWTLRADPAGEHHSVFRTETRAVATDDTARLRFRRYWAAFSPGITMIRWLSLRPLKDEAERRAREVAEEPEGEIQ